MHIIMLISVINKNIYVIPFTDVNDIIAAKYMCLYIYYIHTYNT